MTDVVHVAVDPVKVLKVKEPEGNSKVRTENVVEYSLSYILEYYGTPLHERTKNWRDNFLMIVH